MMRYLSWWRRRQVEDAATVLSKAVWLLAAVASLCQRLGDPTRAAAVTRVGQAIHDERDQWLSLVDSPRRTTAGRRPSTTHPSAKTPQRDVSRASGVCRCVGERRRRAVDAVRALDVFAHDTRCEDPESWRTR